MLPWFRFYNEVLHDPKVQLLPLDLFKAWINLLCIASNNTEKRGTLPRFIDVSYHLNSTVSDVENLVKTLAEKGLFDLKDDGVWHVHGWKARQFKSDTSTERVRKHRNVSTKQDRNVSETLHVTKTETDQIQIRSDTDTEGNKPPIAPLDFEPRWKKYPNKDGRRDAERYWQASVKTVKDLADFDQSLTNYLEHLRVTGYPPKNGKTFFHNWRDFVDWVEPPQSNGNGFKHNAGIQPFLQPVIDEEKEAADFKHFMGESK